MSTYPEEYGSKSLRRFVVKAANTVRHGMPVKLDSGEIVESGAAIADDAIGIAYSIEQLPAGSAAQPAIGWTAPAASVVMVAMLGKGVVPVRVGTGGCTAGSFAKQVSDGATNGTIGGATTKLVCIGQFTETGAVGDLRGCNLGMAAPTVGS